MVLDAKSISFTRFPTDLAQLVHLRYLVLSSNFKENLKLLNDVFPLPPSEGKLPTLPQRYKFPPKLKKLTLADTLLDWKHMTTLGMLESLEILKLKDSAFKGEWWQPEDGGF
ncbi:putative late blight resistance proteinR1B-17 [Abeliophyllum distichum]|uniref:Late blight resistance proteinR1B-17 n=1 Tax=Abeliophyllum distichum TaxID=126358 RepID=A0ABD1Q6K5_9LAMI